MKSFLNFRSIVLAATMSLALTACGSNIDSMTRLPDEAGQGEQVVDMPSDSAEVAPVVETPAPSDITAEARVLASYDFVDPTHMVPDRHLKTALMYYDSNKSRLKNINYLSVIDFSMHSSKKRFFIINMKTGAVWAIRTAHGKNTDPEHDGYANQQLFSNVSGSNKSSLGFYIAAETYYGSHGLSLRLDGISSTNSNARARAIVIHGADYVQEANVIQGRSFGCPAVAMGNRDEVVNRLKNGSLIYAGF